MELSNSKNQLSANTGYLLIPRSSFNALFSNDEKKYHEGKVLLVLMSLCFYKGRHITFNGYQRFCDKGEFIGKYERIAQLTRLSLTTVKRILKRLKNQGVIDVKRICGGSHIRLNSYLEFLEETEGKRSSEFMPSTQQKSGKGNSPELKPPSQEMREVVEQIKIEYKF